MVKAARYILIMAVMVTMCACAAGPNAEPVPPPTPLRQIEVLPKWERVLEAERLNPSFNGRMIAVSSPSAVAGWAELYDTNISADAPTKLEAVNRFFNQWPYVEDDKIWGVDDFWATPTEFMEQSGDCEDYAIAKYYALKTLGVPPEDMCIAAVWNRMRNEGHAVLLVRVEGEYFLLDNFYDEIRLRNRSMHYIPFFYVNEFSAWLHKEKTE